MVDEERARHWLTHGAQPTRTVAGLLRTKGIEADGLVADGHAMRELVEFLARALVEDPDSVQVEEVEEDGDLVLEVTVGGDDLGRLIGKGAGSRTRSARWPRPPRPAPSGGSWSSSH